MLTNRRNGFKFTEASAIESGMTKEEYVEVKKAVMENDLLKKKFIESKETNTTAKVKSPAIDKSKVNKEK